VAVLQFLDRDRVVEIARVLAIDGHDFPIAKVGAAGEVFLFDRRADAPRFVDGLLRVLVGNAVFAKNDFGVNARVVDVAEHLDDAAGRPARRCRPARHLHGDHLSRFGVAGLIARDDDVRRQPFVERRDEPQSRRIDLVPPDDRDRRSLEHLDDAAFSAAVFTIALDAHHDAIAVQRLLHVVRRDENILLQSFDRAFRHHEADPGRMAVELADDQVHAIGQPEAIPFDLDQRPVVDEVAKVAFECRALVARDVQLA
jgi:hypothetical protein